MPLAIPQSAARTRAPFAFGPPLLLLALTLLTRLPLQGHELYTWDSVNFAFALRHFDMAQGAPHAPGYLLYVLMGRVAAALMGGSAQAGYALLATLGTALAAWALFDLGQRLWNVRVGWFAALLLLTSPLFWFYGEVALPHALDGLIVIVAATLSWRVWQGEQRLAPVLAGWLGVAGGFREQTLVFMLPLALVACARLPWRQFVFSAAVLVVTVLLWIIPLFQMSGGYKEYFQVVNAYSESFDRSTSVFLGAGWHGLHHNLDKLFRYTLWAWGFGLIPAVAGLWLWRSASSTPARPDRRTWLLLLWALPGLFFYVFIHMGQQGLIFVYLPVLLLASARGGDLLAARVPWGGGLMAGCFAANALLYLLMPSCLFGDPQFKVLSQDTIRQQDTRVQSQIAVVRRDLPRGAVLLSNDWRFPEYYLPGVPLVPYQSATSDDESDGGRPTAAGVPSARLGQATALAWYEPDLDAFNKSAAQTTQGGSIHGVRLRILRRGPGEEFFIGKSGFGVKKSAP